MDENVTREGPDARSFEERVFARFDSLDERMSRLEDRMSGMEDRVSKVEDRLLNLEGRVSQVEDRLSNLDEKVDRRLQETRPIWEGVQAKLEHIDTKLDVVIADLYEIRTDSVKLNKRVTTLEGVTRP
jgi:predicted  nucleic acid-binding Zn-ribbon protein